MQCNANSVQTSRSKNFNRWFYPFIFPRIWQLCASLLNSNISRPIHVLYLMISCNQFDFEWFAFIREFDFSKHLITFENTYLLSCWFHCIELTPFRDEIPSDQKNSQILQTEKEQQVGKSIFLFWKCSSRPETFPENLKNKLQSNVKQWMKIETAINRIRRNSHHLCS